MVPIKAAIKKVVCKASVQIMVFIPPLRVYNHINATMPEAFTRKGIPQWLKMHICKTSTATYNLNAAPIILDSRKNDAPVL